MYETIIIISIVVFVGFLIIPNKKKGFENLTAHAARQEGCTCKNITRFSMTIDYDCPIHGDWR